MNSIALGLILLAHGAIQLATAIDPSTFFGGSNSEGYTTWLQDTCYEKSAWIESSTEEGVGVAVHWTIVDDTVKLAVAARATGWVAFGIGESGSMLGADIVMYSVADNSLIDSYVLDQAVTPLRDDCQSWTLIDSTTTEDGFTIFEATRLLDTGDTQDRVLADDSNPLVPSTRVLAAWGESPEPSNHGDSNARSAIRFFGNTSTSDELEAFAVAMTEQAQGNFTIRANNFAIPTDRTTYKNFCVTRQDLLAMDVPLDEALHTIGIEPFIDPRTRQYVHHYVVAASTMPWNASLDCDEFPAFETVYVWAPGDVPFNFPSNIGGPLGSGGFQSYQLEIHYDNPLGDTNRIDNSGVRFFYTNQRREFDMGIFSTGDPFVRLVGEVVSPNGGYAQHIFDCPGSCSGNYTTGSLNVIREHLHMHIIGASMVNAQIRNGEIIHEGVVEYWDFNQQGNLAVAQPPFAIEPGDAFRTTCNYYTNTNETWGLGSDNEMCMAFLYYYPRQVVQTPESGDLPFICGVGFNDILPGCEAAYDGATPDFSEARQLDRVFGTTNSATCALTQDVAPVVCSDAAPEGDNDVPSSSGADSNVIGILVTFLVSTGLLALW